MYNRMIIAVLLVLISILIISQTTLAQGEFLDTGKGGHCFSGSFAHGNGYEMFGAAFGVSYYSYIDNGFFQAGIYFRTRGVSSHAFVMGPSILIDNETTAFGLSLCAVFESRLDKQKSKKIILITGLNNNIPRIKIEIG